MEFGIFLTDASFDYSTKVSSIGMFNISNKKEYSFVTKANNPTDAETKGIERVMEIAQQEKIFNLIIICDNKESIKRVKKKMYNERDNSKFWYIQFLWVPREYNQIADFLSKNISETDVNSFQKMKEENVKIKKEKIDNKLSKKYVMDLDYEKNFEDDALSKRIKEFKVLFELNKFDINKLNSKISYLLLSDNVDISLLEILILEESEIELFEKDIKFFEKKNILLKINLELIRDLLIFN